jgi:sterol desaturase/sphingolipid hydroxylase (fatty acid hydroxylase superfamily)
MAIILNIIFYFLAWTFLLYWLHRLAHRIPLVKKFHWHHHKHILSTINSNPTKWHWSNLFLFNDNWPSTVDLWLTEVIPTIIFSAVTGQWWLSVFYYLWAALIQESIEHNPNVDFLLITSGRWHLEHHYNRNKNFGLFFPLWDKTFKTEQ